MSQINFLRILEKNFMVFKDIKIFMVHNVNRNHMDFFFSFFLSLAKIRQIKNSTNLHFHFIRRALFGRFTKILYGMAKRFMWLMWRHTHMIEFPHIPIKM